MITICSIRDARPEEHDETWAIVRSYKNVSPGVRQAVCSVIVQMKVCVTEVSLRAYCKGMDVM